MTANNSHAQVTRANAHAPGAVADYVDFAEVAAPATPSSGFVRQYAKGDGKLYQKDDTGTETDLAAAGGSAITGYVVRASYIGMSVSTASNAAPTASAAYSFPIEVPGTMSIRSLIAHMQAAASGTYQWGLFNYASSASSATKLAGGSGTLNSTGWVSIAATSAPVSITAGNYMLILHAPAANVGSIYRGHATIPTAGSGLIKSQAAYVWDDTPDLTTGWSDSGNSFSLIVVGDLNGTTTW